MTDGAAPISSSVHVINPSVLGTDARLEASSTRPSTNRADVMTRFLSIMSDVVAGAREELHQILDQIEDNNKKLAELRDDRAQAVEDGDDDAVARLDADIKNSDAIGEELSTKLQISMQKLTRNETLQSNGFKMLSDLVSMIIRNFN